MILTPYIFLEFLEYQAHFLFIFSRKMLNFGLIKWASRQSMNNIEMKNIEMTSGDKITANVEYMFTFENDH